jgi:hypothetical protein
MATQVTRRRGTTAQHATFTGALAELTVDTDKKTVVVHDGATAGGIPLAKESDLSNVLVDADIGVNVLAYVAPSTGGNVLTSSGGVWVSSAPAGTNVAAAIVAADNKSTPVDADSLGLVDSADANALKELTWANVKVTLKTYFDTLYGLLGTANIWTAVQTFRVASGVRSEVAATQDAMVLAGRAGGTSSYDVTLTPATLSADRTVTYPDATGTVSLLESDQTWSGAQRGTITTGSHGSSPKDTVVGDFDLAVSNNFTCVPTAAAELEFFSHSAGQSGLVIFTNGGGYIITAAATTYIAAADLAKLSTNGTYLISYIDNGTNTYCTVTAALTSAGA